MIQKTTLLFFTLALVFTGCSDSKQEKSEPAAQAPTTQTVTQTSSQALEKKPLEKKVYTIDEIYNHMCVECHSSDGSGNTEKLTPSMKNLTQKEIEDSLVDVENDKGHVIMEHNRGEILKMGMEYSAKDMAEYMFKRFSTKNN
jgi:cytochrome c553